MAEPLLKLGSKNEAVVRLQEMLGVQPATGYFGTKTDAVVRSFQKQHGLKIDGKVGSQTWGKLNEILAQPAGTRPLAAQPAVAPAVTPGGAATPAVPDAGTSPGSGLALADPNTLQDVDALVGADPTLTDEEPWHSRNRTELMIVGATAAVAAAAALLWTSRKGSAATATANPRKRKRKQSNVWRDEWLMKKRGR